MKHASVDCVNINQPIHGQDLYSPFPICLRARCRVGIYYTYNGRFGGIIRSERVSIFVYSFSFNI